MRKQTNLAEVKLTALALLSTEINETPYSPMIVKHPFTDTGLTALPDGNGGITMINLTVSLSKYKLILCLFFEFIFSPLPALHQSTAPYFTAQNAFVSGFFSFQQPCF